jgi:hypothetical protein
VLLLPFARGLLDRREAVEKGAAALVGNSESPCCIVPSLSRVPWTIVLGLS